MRKLLSFIVALTLIFGCAAPAFAAKECGCNNAPILVVTGMQTAAPTVLDRGTENEKSVFPPEIDITALIPPIVKGIAKGAAYRDWNKFADEIIPAVREIFEPLACNPDGTSKYNVTVEKFDKSMAYYPGITCETEPSAYSDYAEYAILRRASEVIGADHVYFYNYSWRLDPFDHARELHEMIQQIKKETGHSKVTLAPCSMGGAPVMAYLAEYGYDDIAGCVFLSTVFYATLVASDTFTNQIFIDPDCLTRYLTGLGTGNEALDSFLDVLVPVLNDAGLIPALTDFVNNGVDQIKDRVLDEVARDTFFTMPGLWAVIDNDRYETAKKMILDEEENAELIKKIDRYHNEVALKREEILKEGERLGVKMVVLANYDSQCIPVYPGAEENGDGTLETPCMSGGAVCAKITETLGDGYKQKNTACGHNHISPDNVIDASTAVFPEYTWMGKGWQHVCGRYDDGYCDFIMWLLTYRGQPTVHTNKKYPQFLAKSGNQIMSFETGELLPLGFTADDIEGDSTASAPNGQGSGSSKPLTPPTGAAAPTAAATMLFALVISEISRKKRK